MLRSDYYTPPTETDQLLFEKLVPQTHYLRRVKEQIDFDRLRADLLDCYSKGMGAPAEDPVRMVKLEFLQFHYNLSDREVLAEAQVNIAFRFFLNLSLDSILPHPSTLCVFRTRLGADKHQKVFDSILAQAREKGLVHDRLRLKDATHVLANIAVPTTLQLVAQIRTRLLQALMAYDPARVAQEEAEAQRLREVSSDVSDAQRLMLRVAHLRQIRSWAQDLADTLSPVPPNLTQALSLAHKLLADQDDPEAGDKLRSIHDPEARCGKHGAYFDGYLLDVALDADSQLITALDVLAANADEAADASALLQQEQQAHHNRVEALSMDSIGYRGDLLREWTDPQGAGLSVFVPPYTNGPPRDVFGPEAFSLDPTGTVLSCPGGKSTAARKRTRHHNGYQFRFKRADCLGCPLQAQCAPKLPATCGRTVVKNDYEAEYAAAQHKAKTPEYEAVRRQHPRIERKLCELVRHHQGRQARYRGRLRVRVQALLTATVVNVKRILHLMSLPMPAAAATVA